MSMSRRVIPTEKGLQQVGWLISHKDHQGLLVICMDCYSKPPYREAVGYNPPIYHVNIYPYNQRCFECEEMVVIGQSDEWPQLFD